MNQSAYISKASKSTSQMSVIPHLQYSKSDDNSAEK